ncbi:MAG TPA: S24/S26 family peptidase [Candidatus Limnocylindrales bacterium]|nr:S24/S26 family peptidase [Candidatus Limnocylindrales bacterium]
MENQEQVNCSAPAAPAPALAIFGDADPAPHSRSTDAPSVASILESRGRVFLKVSGKSMMPWIRPGDVVFVRRAAIEEMVRGDIAVFERAGCLCMHRVIFLRAFKDAGKSGAALVTKGDAVADADEPVFPQDVRGKAEFLYRGGKEIRLAFGWRKQFGKFLAAISPASRFWLPPFCRAKTGLGGILGCDSVETSQ